MCVADTSPAVASVSLTLFYHSVRLPRSRLRLFWCATSPAMFLLSLTVVSHSGRLPCSRLPRSPLCVLRCATSAAMSLLSLTVVSHSCRAIWHCAAVGAEFAVPWVASGSGVLGVWLMVVWVWVGCWRLSFVQSHVKSSGTTVKTHQKCHFPRSHNFNSSTALDIRIVDIKVLS
jgi:hypothetical protein